MKIALASSINAISRCVTVGVNIYATSIAYRYLGEEHFGIWVVLTSLIMVFAAFGDGGIAQGIISSVASLKEKKGNQGVLEAITSALIISFLLAILLFIIGWIVLFQFGVEIFIGPRNEEELNLAKGTALIVLCCIGFNVLSNVLTNIRHGLGQLNQVSMWNILGALLVIPSIYLVSIYDLSMPFVAAAILGPPIIVRFIVHSSYLILRDEYRPNISGLNIETTKYVMLNGGAFFVIAISFGLAQHSDQLIISYFYGPETVTQYALLSKLFSLPVFLSVAVMNAMWPQLSAKFTRNEIAVLRYNFWRVLLLLTFSGLFMTLFIYVYLDLLLEVWLGNTPKYDDLLAVGFAVYSVVVIPVSMLTLLVIIAELRKRQFWGSVSMTFLNILLTFILVPKIGASGAIIATCISYIVCLLIPYWLISKKILTQSLRA